MQYLTRCADKKKKKKKGMGAEMCLCIIQKHPGWARSSDGPLICWGGIWQAKLS